jgi:4-aminobutyrate aminotransferase
MAKGLGNGFPISGIVSWKELTDQLRPGSMVRSCLPVRRMLLTRLSGRNLFRQCSVVRCCRCHRRCLAKGGSAGECQHKVRFIIITLHQMLTKSVDPESYYPSFVPTSSKIHQSHCMWSKFEAKASWLASSFPTLRELSLSTARARQPPRTYRAGFRKVHRAGMLILTTSAFEVIRFVPPLNISNKDLEKGCAIFVDAVKEAVNEG